MRKSCVTHAKKLSIDWEKYQTGYVMMIIRVQILELIFRCNRAFICAHKTTILSWRIHEIMSGVKAIWCSLIIEDVNCTRERVPETGALHVFYLRFVGVGRSKGDIYSIEVYSLSIRHTPRESIRDGVSLQRGTFMVSVPMAGSRLPRAVFVSRYQNRVYVGAGSGVCDIQEVHVARVYVVLSPLFFFFVLCSFENSRASETRMPEAEPQRHAARNFETYRYIKVHYCQMCFIW